MKKIRAKLAGFFSKGHSSAIAPAAGRSRALKSRQDIIAFAVVTVLLVILLTWLKSGGAKTEEAEREEKEEGRLKLEVASNALDSEKMWRNYFEDRLLENKNKSEEKMRLIENAVNEQGSAWQT